MSDSDTKELMRLIDRMVREGVERGKAEGFKDGYQTGYSAAIQSILQSASAAAQTRIEPVPMSIAPSDPSELGGALARGLLQMRENSAPRIVFDIITSDHPIAGVAILEAAKARGTPIHERTMRTALHRLKRKELIEQDRDGRWKPTLKAIFAEDKDLDGADEEASAPETATVEE